MYLQSCIQSLGYIEFLELLVIFSQMLFHWFADKIIILEKEGEPRNKFTMKRGLKALHKNYVNSICHCQTQNISVDHSYCMLNVNLVPCLFRDVVFPFHKNTIWRSPPLLARDFFWLFRAFPVFDTQNTVGHTHDNGLIIRLRRQTHLVLLSRIQLSCFTHFSEVQ